MNRGRFAREEDGQMIILVALLMTVMFFSVGIAFDLGVLFVERRTMQEAADAGAFAGAVILYNGGTNASARSAASADIALNGYTGSNATIVVNSPPTSGTYSGNALFIEVTITRAVATPLLPQEGGTTSVTAYAVGGRATQTTSYGMFALNGTATKALDLAVSLLKTFTVNGALVQVNSNAATAANKSGLGTFNLIGAGGQSKGGQSGFLLGWTTGVAAQADPFTGALKPTTVGVTSYAGQTTNIGTVTLDPGKYTSALTFGGAASVVMHPGTYILTGGLTLTGTGSISGSGVMIFNTLQNYPTETGSCGAISLGGSGGNTLSPQTSGYYKGLLIFQDKTCTQTVTLTAAGGSTTPTGTIYASKALVTLAGSSNLTLSGQIIADKINSTSTGSTTINYTSANTASFPIPALVQ